MRALALLPLALMTGAALAVEDYDSCVALVERDAPRAVREARIWREETGALGAMHCEALALAAAGSQRLAAERLEALAAAPALSPAEQASVWLQAATLRRDLGEEAAAEAALASGLAVAPGAAAAPLLIERAALRAARGDDGGAREALDSALRLAPGDPEALTLRAAARRRLGDPAGALADAEAALAADPTSAPASLERGLSAAEMGDGETARAAFLAAIAAAPEGPAAKIARAALQALDAPEQE